MKRLRKVPAHARAALLAFFRLEAAAGLLLVAAAALALIVANSPWAEAYAHSLETLLRVGVGDFVIAKSLVVWINDGLMAIFFLLVGLELKRETREGQLAQPGSLLLPTVCALGGMLVPMSIYAALNWGDPTGMRGVAIPAATDIAFALGVMTLLGSRVPLQLKLLLTAIAVLDDLGAIVIIAVFYTEQLSLLSLAVAGAALLVLVVLNRSGIVSLLPYLVVGVVLWVAVSKSGVHATLAGAALGLTIPLRDRRDRARSPLQRLETGLHPWVAFAILPVFAFANAGLPLHGFAWGEIGDAVPLGILLGLVFGKPVGVMLAAALARAVRRAAWPEGLGTSQIFGMALLCGIGFTMSLFIKNLAFASAAPGLAASAQLAVLIASLASAIAGYLWLRFAVRGVAA